MVVLSISEISLNKDYEEMGCCGAGVSMDIFFLFFGFVFQKSANPI